MRRVRRPVDSDHANSGDRRAFDFGDPAEISPVRKPRGEPVPKRFGHGMRRRRVGFRFREHPLAMLTGEVGIGWAQRANVMHFASAGGNRQFQAQGVHHVEDRGELRVAVF